MQDAVQFLYQVHPYHSNGSTTGLFNQDRLLNGMFIELVEGKINLVKIQVRA